MIQVRCTSSTFESSGFPSTFGLDGLDPPRRIEWSVLGDLEVAGQWTVRRAEDGNGSTLELVVEYDTGSIDSTVVSLPFGMSLDWLTSKGESLAEREVENVLDWLVSDLEAGDERS